MNILNKIWNEDCVGEGAGMSRIADKSVDLILCDLPYGTTQNKWDVLIPFDKLWEQYKRIIKLNGAIVLTANQPFTSLLITSNMKMYKYCWVWKKSKITGVLNAKKQPVRQHEDIVVFCDGSTTYNPQGLIKVDQITKQGGNSANYGARSSSDYIQEFTNYPRTVLDIASEGKTVHPTQKPVALFEYLIKTYTNDGDLVLDNCAGSFTTAVACENLNRNWICMEQDREYCKIGWKRIQENRIRLKEATLQLTL